VLTANSATIRPPKTKRRIPKKWRLENTASSAMPILFIGKLSKPGDVNI
jgi:hypothetical protein